MHTLFTYGTLQCDDIMHRVAGQCRKVSSALLPGYCCLTVKNETYPGIMPAEGCSVPGCVYEGISDAALERLDRFEGEMYRRVMVTVVLDDQSTQNVFAYIVKNKFRDSLSDEIWDLESFLSEGKTAFLAHYFGFCSL